MPRVRLKFTHLADMQMVQIGIVEERRRGERRPAPAWRLRTSAENSSWADRSGSRSADRRDSARIFRCSARNLVSIGVSRHIDAE